MPGHLSGWHFFGQLLDLECLQIHELGLFGYNLEGVQRATLLLVVGVPGERRG